MPTITLHPSQVFEADSNFKSVDAAHPFDEAFGRSQNSATYAQWYMLNGGAVTTQVQYGFDVSAIPDNAIIKGITIHAKCQVQDDRQFYVGNTVVSLKDGTQTVTRTNNKIFGETATIVSLSNTDFDRERLNNFRIGIDATRGYIGTKKSTWVRFYGADLVVEYEVPAKSALYVRQNGQYVAANQVFKKANGVWVKQENLANVFDKDTKYVTI